MPTSRRSHGALSVGTDLAFPVGLRWSSCSALLFSASQPSYLASSSGSAIRTIVSRSSLAGSSRASARAPRSLWTQPPQAINSFSRWRASSASPDSTAAVTSVIRTRRRPSSAQRRRSSSVTWSICDVKMSVRRRISSSQSLRPSGSTPLVCQPRYICCTTHPQLGQKS